MPITTEAIVMVALEDDPGSPPWEVPWDQGDHPLYLYSRQHQPSPAPASILPGIVVGLFVSLPPSSVPLPRASLGRLWA